MEDFRSPSQENNINIKGKPTGEILTPSETNVETPISQYESVHQIPYTVKFFEIDDYKAYDDITDVDDVRLNVKTIEEYVYKKIADNNLYDTQAVYDDIINELFEKIGIDKNERMESRLGKVAKYIELLSRNKTTAQRRKELFKKQEEAEKRLNSYKNRLLKINESIKDLNI